METPREPSVAPAWARWTLVAITVAAAVARLPGLTAEEPWFDEVFSIVLASQDLPELWRRTVADQTNPPGSYLALWAWTRIGGFDLAWMRLLPTLAAIVTVPAMALAARAVGLGWLSALTAAALAAASPLLLAMSSEIRAYALVALGTTLVLAAAAHRRTALVAVGGSVLVLLHYFGAFVVAAVFAATLWDDRHRWRAAIAGAMPPALVLGAWVALVVSSASGSTVGANAGWISAVGARGLLSFGSQAIGTFGTTFGAVVVLAVLVRALWVASRSLRAVAPPQPALRYAVAVAVVPVLLVGALSLLSDRELWVARYLIITLPGWWLLVAHLVERAPRAAAPALAALILAWAVSAGAYAEWTRPRKTAWSGVARALAGDSPRTVCAAESFVALPLRYHALGAGVPLTVLDLHDCTPARAPGAIILRVGTEGALTALTRAGARVGPPRALGTRLPETVLHPIAW